MSNAMPIIVLIAGVVIFKKKFILTDKKVEKITGELKARKSV